MKKLFTFALFAALLLTHARALAWSAPGHMVIAAEAYHLFSPELQKRVTEILKAHPDYAKWEGSYGKYGEGMDLPTFVFMRAAVWPDEVGHSGKAEAKFDHPHWHYVDWAVRPPTFAVEAEPAPEDDALYGIAQSEKFLGDAQATPEMRAVYLSYLIHLVGDIHQPLHCASLYTDAYPHGDRGGNDFWVKPANKSIRLHAFWDQLLGSRQNEREQLKDSIRILAGHEKKSLPELQSATTPKQWSLADRQLAVDQVYLRGELKGGTSAENAPSLPAGYSAAAKKLAETQAALAGYRLADEIEKTLR